MLYFFFKTAITAMTVVLISEIAKRSSMLAGLIVSIPLTTFLAMIWLYWESQETQKIIDLSHSTLLMIIPSCTFFIFLPTLLKFDFHFSLALFVSILLTASCYYLFISILQKLELVQFF